MCPRKATLIFAASTFLFCLSPSFLSAVESIPTVDAMVDSALKADSSHESSVSPLTGQVLSAARGEKNLLGVVTMDQTDKRARIYEVKGDVRVAKKGSQKWNKARKNFILSQGDMILTGKNGAVSITFDATYQNVTHIPQNTRAVFRSIEPTDVFLEDGTLYNFFDGLPEGSNWKVTTPTAVAAVRGTQFLANYTSADGHMISAVFDVPEDGYRSTVTLIDILSNGQEGSTADIPEGKQIDLQEGQPLDPSLLKEIDAHWVEQIQSILKDLAKRRAEQSGVLPPTGGEADGVNDVMNDVLADARNQALNAFNPQDLISPPPIEQDNTPSVIEEQESPKKEEPSGLQNRQEKMNDQDSVI